MRPVKALAPRILALALLAWAMGLGLSRVGVVGDLMAALERTSLDYRAARYRGDRLARGVAPSEVVIVAVDDASLARLGRFPLWPRSYHARLLDTLTAKGAAAVAFDLLFAEPDALPARVRAARAEEIAERTATDPALVDRLLAASGGDSTFAGALRRNAHAVLGADPVSGALPLPDLAEAAAAVGHVDLSPDPDGMLRRARTAAVPGDALPPLAWAVVAAAGAPLAPMSSGGEELLDFLGPRGTFLTLSYADVLEGKVDAALVRGRIVLIGATAAGLGDVFATPFGEDLPGVEAHATLAYQLLEGRRPRVAGTAAGTLAALACAAGGAAVVSTAGPALAAVGALGVAAAYVVASFEVFAQADVRLPFAFPLLVWALGVLGAAAYRYGTEERRRRQIQHAFGRYVAPEVVDEIAREPGALRVGGQAREVTVGFVDIRGFTGISERLEPEALARFLHAFFTVVEDEIHRRRGTVDKYIGDAVMMIFGAPNTLDDAPARACDAALGIVEAVRCRADAWRALGVPEVRVGVGLETGVAVVGNIGSERRFDYTALGDTVNVASRLQDLNKELGTSILVGPGTRAAAGDAFLMRAHGTMTLRGRPAPLSVFELAGRSDAQAPRAARSQSDPSTDGPHD